jgi:hypothetical protein
MVTMGRIKNWQGEFCSPGTSPLDLGLELHLPHMGHEFSRTYLVDYLAAID